jgi:exopolysaccharide production protein ExoQ
VLLLPLVAFVSIAWSPDPFLSLRRASAFAGTTLFGLSLGAAYTPQDAIGLVVRGLVSACLFSCVIVVIAPVYGVHQAGDAIQAIHAGLWRGIFGHRNTLGLWAGVSVGATLVFGKYAFRTRAAGLLALLASAACLIGANSGAGYTICAATILVSLFALNFVRQPAGRRGLYILLAILAVIIALLLRSSVEMWGLKLLGKASDLTGRTLLWYYILQIVDETPSLLGGGYFAGFVNLNTEVSAILQTTFGSAHNGYLETFVYLGYAGLIVCILMMLWLGALAFRWMILAARSKPGIRAFPLVILSVVAIHNLVESTIILPNNLNALLVGVIAGMISLPCAEASPVSG